jgi:hypothetical protein
LGEIWHSLIDLVWSGIADSFTNLVSVWWEHPELVDHLNEFRRVCCFSLLWHCFRTWLSHLKELVCPSCEQTRIWIYKRGFDRYVFAANMCSQSSRWSKRSRVGFYFSLSLFVDIHPLRRQGRSGAEKPIHTFHWNWRWFQDSSRFAACNLLSGTFSYAFIEMRLWSTTSICRLCGTAARRSMML